MGQGKYIWSKIAATNASVDSSINWAEGMAPSAVNDSARAQMAREAEWRDDISGTITTGGTATAYTVTSNQVFDTLAHMSGAMIAFIPHATNTGGAGTQVTLNVDGLGAKPIRFAPSVNIESGVLILGTPYVATYVNADSAFYLRGPVGNPYGIPLGGLMPYIGSTAPNTAFALPSGQAISRTTYATLFTLVSTTFGIGDGSTTFNLPDLRGRAIFGLDNMGGSAASRITVAGGTFDGTVLGGTGGGQNQTLTQAQLPAVAPTFTGTPQTWSLNQTNIVISNSGQSATGPGPVVGNTTTTPTVTVTPAGTISNLGSGNAHPILSPAMTLPYILRVI